MRYEKFGSYSGISRLTYELTQFIPLLLIFALATVFYIWGHMEKRNSDVVVDLNVAEGTVASDSASAIAD